MPEKRARLRPAIWIFLGVASVYLIDVPVMSIKSCMIKKDSG